MHKSFYSNNCNTLIVFHCSLSRTIWPLAVIVVVATVQLPTPRLGKLDGPRLAGLKLFQRLALLGGETTTWRFLG